MRTRCKDRDGNYIYEGDILHVEEYPDKYVGGSLNFEGVVTIENSRAYVVYLDIGEEEGLPISMIPVKGRHIYPEKWRKDVEEQGCEFYDDGNRWIPVSERLPDEGDYLVCFDDGFVTTATYGMVIDRMDWELWADSGEPIAWMPLPQPYKAD